MQKRLLCKYIAKLIAICEGIQIYPVYSVEACRAAFYSICFRYVGRRIFLVDLRTLSFCSPSVSAFYLSVPGLSIFAPYRGRRTGHRFSEQKLRLSVLFFVTIRLLSAECRRNASDQNFSGRQIYDRYLIRHFAIKISKKNCLHLHAFVFVVQLLQFRPPTVLQSYYTKYYTWRIEFSLERLQKRETRDEFC